MDLLKGSLLSQTPLTDLVLHNNKHMENCVTAALLLPQIEKDLSSSNSNKMILRAIVKKSTNELLFALANEDFIDFLYSFLVIPLGGVECLLDNKTSLRNIDNLYLSLANMNDKYLRSRDTKNRLLKPQLPPMYLTKNHMFPLNEQMTHAIYYFESGMHSANCAVDNGSWMCFKDPKGDGSFVKQPGTFIVTDNISVFDFHLMNSSVAIVDAIKISLSDVQEMELHVGLEEVIA
ncbi:hypothetical protein Salat_0070800 [Sesamum alatum]|uniref:Uncharacterized protein n=1 Tax=Sesamum alatum TaxID=300844 RepID=A0AAE1YVT5_9LAMI|nr:hypothetical protein Salat_0070800 [Sesamum alatum]